MQMMMLQLPRLGRQVATSEDTSDPWGQEIAVVLFEVIAFNGSMWETHRPASWASPDSHVVSTISHFPPGGAMSFFSPPSDHHIQSPDKT
jgi:hypothetical protein